MEATRRRGYRVPIAKFRRDNSSTVLAPRQLHATGTAPTVLTIRRVRYWTSIPRQFFESKDAFFTSRLLMFWWRCCGVISFISNLYLIFHLPEWAADMSGGIYGGGELVHVLAVAHRRFSIAHSFLSTLS